MSHSHNISKLQALLYPESHDFNFLQAKEKVVKAVSCHLINDKGLLTKVKDWERYQVRDATYVSE